MFNILCNNQNINFPKQRATKLAVNTVAVVSTYIFIGAGGMFCEDGTVVAPAVGVGGDVIPKPPTR